MDNDKQVYMTLRFSGNNVVWSDAAECLNIVADFAPACRVVPVAEDPYVPQEKPAEAAQDAPAPKEAPAPQDVPAAQGEWTCPDCGQVNSGNFCPNCGAARPE